MQITRDGTSFVIDMIETDFFEAPVRAGAPGEVGHITAGGLLTGGGVQADISINMGASIYRALGSLASGGRSFSGSGFDDEVARRMSDEFLNLGVQLGDYTGTYDLEPNEVDAAIAGITIETVVSFSSAVYTGENYILRADVGTQKIKFYLIPTTELTPTTSDEFIYIDSYPFQFPVEDSDDAVSASMEEKEVIAFKVAAITKTVDLGSRRLSQLNTMTLFLGYVHRFRYPYMDVKGLYESSLTAFEKFGFITAPAVKAGKFCSVAFGINASVNAFVIVDLNTASLSELGVAIFCRGTVPATFIVGDINWPNDIAFAERLSTFDSISDGSSDWDDLGPMNDTYTDTSDFPTECMHSWQGRSSMTLKSLTKSNAGVKD